MFVLYTLYSISYTILAGANSTDISAEEKKELLRQGLMHALHAVEVDAGCAAAHKWTVRTTTFFFNGCKINLSAGKSNSTENIDFTMIQRIRTFKSFLIRTRLTHRLLLHLPPPHTLPLSLLQCYIVTLCTHYSTPHLPLHLPPQLLFFSTDLN
jgi:hypothetical protein